MKCPLIRALILSLLLLIVASQKIISAGTNTIEAKIDGSKSNIEFRVKMKANGYIGIGFGKVMALTDMIIVLWKKDNTLIVSDTYSKSYGPPADDQKLGGNNDVKNVKKVQDGDGAIIEFSRSLITKDKTLDYQFEKLDIDIPVCFAWLDGDKILNHKANRFDSSMMLEKKSGDFVWGGLIEDSGINFYDVHGITQLIFWTIINTIGFIAMRHFKHIYFSRFIHIACCGLASASTIILGYMAIQQGQDSSSSSTDSIHKIFGKIVFIATLVQVMLGIVNSIFIYTFKQKSDFIHSFKWVHYVIGYILSFILHICTITGFKMMYEKHVIYTYLMAVMFPLTILIFDIHHIFLNYFSKFNHQSLNEISETKYNNLPILKIEDVEDSNSKRKIVLLDNLVCDITDFINSHPGGASNIEPFVGKDISRYLSGTFAPHSGFKLYKHRFQTIKYAIEKFTIGKLHDNHQIAFIENNKEKISVYPNCGFERVSYILIAKDTYKVELACNCMDFKFAVGLPGVDFLGRHYSVTSKIMNKTRYYSICFILNNQVNAAHRRLMDCMLNSQELKLTTSFPELKLPTSKSQIEFHLKKYNRTESMSYHLTSDKKLKGDLNVLGPIGVGLGLKSANKISGNYIAIAGGSGIFCFIDFVAFTLRYMNHIVNKSIVEIYPNEDFSYVNSDFKLIYFSSFKDKEEAIMNDFCEKMAEIDKKFKLNVFEFYPRISSVDKSRWDDKYMESKLGNGKNIARIFLCGPQLLVDEMNSVFDKLKLKDKVLMV